MGHVIRRRWKLLTILSVQCVDKLGALAILSFKKYALIDGT